jgi:hypothetical protein
MQWTIFLRARRFVRTVELDADLSEQPIAG